MNRELSDYLEICSKFRADGLSKPERKQRHALLSQWEKTDCESGMLPLGEIQDFWDNHNDICWNRVFINKVICPVVAADLETGGYDGLRFLFHCFRGHEDMYLSHKFTIVQMMHVSGHKTQKTFMDYIKLSSDEIADEIDAIVNGAKEEVF